MAGIVAFGAYVPLHRLGAGTAGWKGSGERAVASFDEDSLTMGVAAGIDCLRGRNRQSVDALYFATTTPPYEEKLSATTIALGVDLRRDVHTADLGNSLRGATIALKAALDAVAAGSQRQALVIASDLRVAPPGTSFEQEFGDGAAAVLVGNADVAVEVEASYSVADEILDIWRLREEPFIHSWEDRFTAEQGYLKVLPEAVGGLLKKANLQPQDIAKLVINGAQPRRVQQAAKDMGFDPKTQLQDPLYAQIGNTGTAAALIGLVSALETAKPGDRILVAAYGNGADALLLKVTPAINAAKGKSRFASYMSSKKNLPDYASYLRWRGLMPQGYGAKKASPLTPSASAIKREVDQIYRLQGQRCRECGTIQFPMQRICTSCHTKDAFEPVALSDKRATLFTYSMDYLWQSPEPPTVFCVMDLQGGGRLMLTMTDRDSSQVKVGMPLELSFRKLATVDGMNNYYWKCMPIRGEEA